MFSLNNIIKKDQKIAALTEQLEEVKINHEPDQSEIDEIQRLREFFLVFLHTVLNFQPILHNCFNGYLTKSLKNVKNKYY